MKNFSTPIKIHDIRCNMKSESSSLAFIQEELI